MWCIAYRVGFRTVRLWWRLRRPAHDGAIVAVWCGGRFLVVQQFYRSNSYWPGGGISRGGEPREAAWRELLEELGLAVDPDDPVLARDTMVDRNFRRDRGRVSESRPHEEPVLRLDNREVVAAHFVEPRALLAGDGLAPFILEGGV